MLGINYTMDGASRHPVTTMIQASFLTQLPERKETTQGFHHDANGDKQFDWNKRKLRMDQELLHNTNLIDKSEKEACTE